jgi:hypothetical protein
MRNVVIATMLVIAGVGSNYMPRPGDADSAEEVAAKGKAPALLGGSAPQPIDDPLDLLNDFLNPRYEPAARPKGTCGDPIDRLRKLLVSTAQPCIPQQAVSKAQESAEGLNCSATREFMDTGLQLHFLIATIPDPARTHLGLSFDRYLEAIINAAEAARFSYDRYWLPWHVNPDDTNPDPDKQAELDQQAESRHRKPGIIILRKRPYQPERKDPLEAKESKRNLEESSNQALIIFLVGETPTAGINRRQFTQAAEIVGKFKTCSDFRGVLGPAFSGSAMSLQAAVNGDLSGFPAVKVISGAASVTKALKPFAERTVHSSSALRDALKMFRKTLLRGRGKLALLSEAATDFGATVHEEGEEGDTFRIFYPREISRLRNVYPEQKNSAAAQVAKLQQQLFLRLRDSRSGEDTLPQFSDQTPLTQESIMLQISETLRRDHVGIAIITGTDVLDLLFLSRHLRELSPDVRLMLWDSDLLFVHGTDTLDFSGILAMSTYPPGSPSWPVADETSARYYFASNRTEGIYNACVFLLHDLDPKKRGPFPRDYASPTEPWNTTPPIWLSVVGHDSYWPLAVSNSGSLTPDAGMRDAKLMAETSIWLDPGWPTKTWIFIFCFLSFFAAGYIFTSFYVREPHDGLPRWCSFLHPRPYPELPWRASYCFFMSLALWLAYLTALAPVLRLAFMNFHPEWMLMVAMGTVVSFAFLSVLVRGLVSLAMIVLTTALGTAAILAVFFWERGLQDEESFFRALRSVQLGSGVGANLPIFFLLLAFAWWSSVHIQRARLFAEHRPEVASVAANDAVCNLNILDDWLQQPFLYIDRFGVIIVLLAAAITAPVAILYVISIDGWLFNAVVCALLIPLSILLFLTAYAFARIWRALDRFLRALETEPIRFAFSNLPPDVSWSPLMQDGARRQSYTTLLRSLESLRALEEFDPAYYPDLSTDIALLESDFTKIMTPVHQGVEEPIEANRSAQLRLSQITEKLAAALATKDWNTNNSASLTKLKKASGTPTVHKGIANWFHVGKPADLEITSSPEDSDPKDTAEILAAEVIALRYLAYIRYIIRHLRNLLSFLTTGFLLMTLALNCYPFQMLNLIRWSITLIFLIIAAVLIYVFQKMNRNEILRRVTDTPAGAVDKDLFGRVISAGALPVLAVVASHFPSVGRFLFSWVQPAIAALH